MWILKCVKLQNISVYYFSIYYFALLCAIINKCEFVNLISNGEMASAC